MGLARSAFYDASPVHLGLDELVARIGTIRDEFECYGYRRVGAALRHQGVVVTARSCAASCASTAYSQSDAAILDTWSRSVVG